MKKYTFLRLFALVLMLCTAFDMKAVPTHPRSFIVTQKDGTKIELRFVGDENFHYYCTMDGVPVVKIDGSYYYADIDDSNILKSTGILVHETALRNSSENNYVLKNRDKVMSRIKSTWSERLNTRNAERAEKVNARNARRKVLGRPSTYIGKKKGIVILVNYKDLAMKPTSTKAAWDAQFNEHGYSKNNHKGSVRDYFLDQSYQKLDIEFDVVGPYTVSQNWRYYGKGGEVRSDAHPCQLVSEACKLANADVNFKDYDWDGDGEVDQVFVVYAGYSEAAGYDDDAIWPHEWHLAYGTYYGDGQGALTLDGVKVDNYALSSELNGRSGSTMDYIGTAVHEFSHCLGLPDFYDVDGYGTQCMDYWDVLDAGCYSGPNWRGEVPTGYTAYERNFAGWLTFDELTDPCKITGMENLGDTPKAYIYHNKGNKNEYFILENRQSKGWFAYPSGCHGLFVYHVDYDRSLWEGDRPNNDPEHPRMTFVPADKSFNRDNVSGMAADFFPGTKTVRSLSNTSHTSCYGKMFNKNSDGTYNTNMELSSITESGGKISFTFNGGEAGVKKKLSKMIDEVKALVDTPHEDLEEDATFRLKQAIDEAENVMNNALTTPEYMAAMDSLGTKAVKFLYVANPTDSLQPFDISFTYKNPEITSNEGWKDEVANNGYAYSNNCGEYTNMRFTLSQSSAYKLPKGEYLATCQAFQSAGNAEVSAANTVNTTFYARTKSIKIKNIMDEVQDERVSLYDNKLADGRFLPQNTKSADAYFKKGFYTNSIDFATISTSGTSIKVGLKCLTAKADYWTCFSNFKLYYKGNPEATDIKNIRDEVTSSLMYDISGRKVSGERPLSRGIYIVGGKKVVVK